MGIEDFIISKAEQEENLRIFSGSKKYIGTHPSEWPFSIPLWDLASEAQYYVTCERTEKALRRYFPNGLLLTIVNFIELDAKLVTIFRRTPKELWTTHDNNKIARIIFNWSEGVTLTPPLLRPFNEFGLQEITITDGSHRLAVSRALGIKILHILIERDAYFEMKKILPSLQLIRVH